MNKNNVKAVFNTPVKDQEVNNSKDDVLIYKKKGKKETYNR